MGGALLLFWSREKLEEEIFLLRVEVERDDVGASFFASRFSISRSFSLSFSCPSFSVSLSTFSPISRTWTRRDSLAAGERAATELWDRDGWGEWKNEEERDW